MEESYMRRFGDRKLALAGDKRMCRHFYLQFRSLLDVRYYGFTRLDLKDGDAAAFFEDLQDITVVPMRPSMVFQENLLFVLCVEHAFRRDYDRVLYQKGLEWGTDYIDALYIIQYYRRKYRTALPEKKLWIFGAGNNGKYYYQNFFKRAYSVAGFVSNFEGEKECRGLPVIRPEELLKQENAYVVICSDADILMAEKLCRLGFLGGRDFCFAETLPKALFHAVGTCQIINSADCLYRNKEFFSRYYGCNYFENVYDLCSDADNRRLKAYGKFCDVVFYNVANAGTDEFRNYEPLIARYYKNAMQISMPFYYFKGQMMQATDGANPYGLRAYGGQPFWFRGDQEINRMVEEGCDIEKIVTEVSRENYWSCEEILKNFRRELKKVEVLDRFSSFPIRQFIEAHYREISVFVDGTHFHRRLYIYIADQIANALGMEPISDPDEIKEAEAPFSAMPVYPCVQHALKMEQQNSYPFFNIERGDVEYLDIEEYTRRYARYVMDVRNMYKTTGTDWR